MTKVVTKSKVANKAKVADKAPKAKAAPEADKATAIDRGLQLAAGVLQGTDVLVAVPGARAKGATRDGNGNVNGGNSFICKRLAALVKYIGKTLDETKAAIANDAQIVGIGGWNSVDDACHVARGNIQVARNGYLLDTTGKVTPHKAPNVKATKAAPKPAKVAKATKAKAPAKATA